jgi:hypothetical protein
MFESSSVLLQNATSTSTSINAADIVTVVVAVVSSLGAVTLSAFLADFFRERRGWKKARSLAVACLESVYIQMPEIETYFKTLARGVEGEENLRSLFSISKTVSLVDISLFAKVRENLLNLEFELANAIVSLELYVRRINREAKGWVELLSEGYTEKGSTERAALVPYLKRNSKVFGKEVELIITLTNLIVTLRKQLFERRRLPNRRKKVEVDWAPVTKKSQESLDALAETMGG